VEEPHVLVLVFSGSVQQVPRGCHLAHNLTLSISGYNGVRTCRTILPGIST
jgi:hypothetical protein